MLHYDFLITSLIGILLAAARACCTNTTSVEVKFESSSATDDVSRYLNTFVLWKATLSRDGNLITRHYTLGQRHSDKDRLARKQSEQFGDINCHRDCDGRNWTIRVEYPSKVDNFVITFVDLKLTQTSTGAEVKVVEGGYGFKKIRFTITIVVTSVVDFQYKIYVRDSQIHNE